MDAFLEKELVPCSANQMVKPAGMGWELGKSYCTAGTLLDSSEDCKW